MYAGLRAHLGVFAFSKPPQSHMSSYTSSLTSVSEIFVTQLEPSRSVTPEPYMDFVVRNGWGQVDGSGMILERPISPVPIPPPMGDPLSAHVYFEALARGRSTLRQPSPPNPFRVGPPITPSDPLDDSMDYEEPPTPPSYRRSPTPDTWQDTLVSQGRWGNMWGNDAHLNLLGDRSEFE